MFVKIYDNYHAGIAQLPREEQDAFYGAVVRYAFEGDEPDFDGVALAVWMTIRDFIDTSLKGQENGSKGGDGRGNKRGNTSPRTTTAKTPMQKTPAKDPSKTPSENQKKLKEKKGIGKENTEGFFSYSNDEEKEESGLMPVCPLCGCPLSKTGMEGPDYWWCEECREPFHEDKAVWVDEVAA